MLAPRMLFLYFKFLNRILFLKIIENYFLKKLEYIQTNFDFIQNKKCQGKILKITIS